MTSLWDMAATHSRYGNPAYLVSSGDALPHTICAFTFSHFLVRFWIEQSSSACKSKLVVYLLIGLSVALVSLWNGVIELDRSVKEKIQMMRNLQTPLLLIITTFNSKSKSVTEPQSSVYNYNAGNSERQKAFLRKYNRNYFKYRFVFSGTEEELNLSASFTIITCPTEERIHHTLRHLSTKHSEYTIKALEFFEYKNRHYISTQCTIEKSVLDQQNKTNYNATKHSGTCA